MVAGDGGDNIGKQSGGWTITWQGTGNSNEDFPGATSIYEGIKNAIESTGGSAEFSESAEWKKEPDVAVVVFGEEPYAEGQGDIAYLENKTMTESTLQLIEKLRSQGIPVVSVFLTGRPLWVNSIINASEAFVVAWLPGSEGGGIS